MLAQARSAEYHVKFDVNVLSTRHTVLRLLYFKQIDTLSEKSKTRNLLNAWTFTTVAGHENVKNQKKSNIKPSEPDLVCDDITQLPPTSAKYAVGDLNPKDHPTRTGNFQKTAYKYIPTIVLNTVRELKWARRFVHTIAQMDAGLNVCRTLMLNGFSYRWTVRRTMTRPGSTYGGGRTWSPISCRKSWRLPPSPCCSRRRKRRPSKRRNRCVSPA